MKHLKGKTICPIMTMIELLEMFHNVRENS